MSFFLSRYVQVTSPIRRYGDLCVHYQLKTFLRSQRSKHSKKKKNKEEIEYKEEKEEEIENVETATTATTTSVTTVAVGEFQLPFHSGKESNVDDSRDIVALARDTGDAAFLQKSSTGI